MWERERDETGAGCTNWKDPNKQKFSFPRILVLAAAALLALIPVPCARTSSSNLTPLNHVACIVGKKSVILDPGPFSAKIRKVDARLGNLRQIRKVHPEN